MRSHQPFLRALWLTPGWADAQERGDTARAVRKFRLVALIAVISLPGCGAEGPSLGRDAPERVLSLTPSITDLIVALGERTRLVGRTRYDTVGLDGLPSVGGSLNPSLEVVAGLQPDLVIADLDVLDDRVAAIRRLGLRVERVRSATLADVRATIALLGEWLAIPARAESLWGAVADTLVAVRSDAANRERIRVFYAVWTSPPMSVGRGTFVADLIEIAGGENIFADTDVRWPTVSFEAVIERDPQIVILPTESAGPDPLNTLQQMAGWKLIPAIRRGRVQVVSSELFSRPGPRLGEAARQLFRILHGHSTETPNGPH